MLADLRTEPHARPASNATSQPLATPFVCDGTGPLPRVCRSSVIMLGSFDGMHLGHRALLRQSLNFAFRLGVPLSIMQCTPHPRGFFFPQTAFRISTGHAQTHVISASGIDLIYRPRFDGEFAAQSPETFITQVLGNYLGVNGVVVGRDFQFGHRRSGNVQLLRDMATQTGYQVLTIDDEERDGHRISSSRIRAAILAGDIALANRLLGEPWLTEVSHHGGNEWRFAPEGILPLSGDWPVIALDRYGRTLRECRLALGEGRRAFMKAPPETVLLRWLP